MKFPFVLNLSPSLLCMVTVHTADFETNSAFSEGCNIVLMCDYFFLLLILVTYIFIIDGIDRTMAIEVVQLPLG